MKQILKINLLGNFSIEYGENSISDQLNRSKRIWSLIEYFVVNRDRQIPQDELIQLFWADGQSNDPVNTLKVLMHRARATLSELSHENGHQIILHKRGIYGWNPKNVCEVDTDEFEHLIKEAANETENLARKTELLLRAEALYKGDFLQKNTHDVWTAPYVKHYRDLYLNVVGEVSGLLYDRKRYDELIVLCRKAVQFDQRNEQLYLYLIQSLIHTGQQGTALETYQHVSELFFREFGLTPSDELIAIYREIIKTIKSPETNLAIIQESLNETNQEDGCFFCEHEIFKSIYQLQVRSLARLGVVFHIVLISVVDHDKATAPSSQKQLNRTMDYLKGTIQHTLRKGDVFTRYSVNQYLIMLPKTTFDTVNIAMNRMVKAFYRDYQNPSIKVSYKTQPVIPWEVFTEKES